MNVFADAVAADPARAWRLQNFLAAVDPRLMAYMPALEATPESPADEVQAGEPGPAPDQGHPAAQEAAAGPGDAQGSSEYTAPCAAVVAADVEPPRCLHADEQAAKSGVYFICDLVRGHDGHHFAHGEDGHFIASWPPAPTGHLPQGGTQDPAPGAAPESPDPVNPPAGEGQPEAAPGAEQDEAPEQADTAPDADPQP